MVSPFVSHKSVHMLIPRVVLTISTNLKAHSVQRPKFHMSLPKKESDPKIARVPEWRGRHGHSPSAECACAAFIQGAKHPPSAERTWTAFIGGAMGTRHRQSAPSLERYTHSYAIPITSFMMERTIDERTGYRSPDRAIN